jgi:hypothetical protein
LQRRKSVAKEIAQIEAAPADQASTPAR